MSKPIRIHAAVSDQGSQRLQAFPGRHLSEHSFDLMQAYVDQRVDPLLGNNHPGILEGLQVSSHHGGRQIQLHVQPGTAVGADGRAIRVFFPIELDWDALLDAHRHANAQAEATLHGFYFLTVRRMVGRVEDSPEAKPCTRDQLDPLRDSRLETYATLDLQFITSLSSLMGMSQRRAVNRLCVRFLSEPVFDRDSGAVPLGLVRIANDTPQWLETEGGRFMAQKDAPYHCFSAHWESLLETLGGSEPARLQKSGLSLPGAILSSTGSAAASPGMPAPPRVSADLISGGLHPSARVTLSDDRFRFERDDAADAVQLSDSLRDLLGIDYMPAAGRFPQTLVGDIAGQESAEDGGEWELPELLFDPRDLQIELLPIPASTAFGAINRELPRGAVNLVHHQGDRLRLMVAVEDRDYRPELMDLPEIDHDLIDELYQRAQAAIEAEHTWARAHRDLYQDLDDGLLNAEGAVTEDALALLKNTYLVPGYSVDDDPDYPLLNHEQRSQLGLPEPITPALTPSAYLDELAGEGSGRPYTNTSPVPPDDFVLPLFEASGEDGLYRQSADLAAQIAALEEGLEENHDLIDELNDFLSVQRQQLDSITTNFAALAGGVAGDGSGLSLMRWNNTLKYLPKDEG